MNKNHKLRSVQIELTARCNERCIHCYIPHENKCCDMDTALLTSLLDQCGDMGVEQIVFSGGEPMLHSAFVQAVSNADRHGFKTRIFSNLTLLGSDTLTALKAFRIYEIQASLYSVDSAVHDTVTGVSGSCEKTKLGIETLLENNIPVFISCPLMKQNKDSYPGVLEYAKNLGVRCAPNTMIMAQSNGSRDSLAHRLSIDESLEVIQAILENDAAYNADRFLPGCTNTEDALPCVQNICKGDVSVNAKGEVLPSPAWNRVLGDLHTQTLRDIWENSGDLKKIQSITLEKYFPQCVACPDIHFCGMSLEANVNENPAGSPFVIPKHICTNARRMRELVHRWHTSRNPS